MDNLIGKKFVTYKYSSACIYKIIAFDDEVNKYIVRNNDLNTIIFYSALSKKELEKCFFNRDDFIKDIDKRIEEVKSRYNAFLPIIEKLGKDKLFTHNFKGVCEGLKNIEVVTKLVKKYEENNYDNKSLLYKELISNYKKEINSYKKGIRRNKKVLYRICSAEEYSYLEKVYSTTAIEDIFEVKCNLQKLEKEKIAVLEAFSEF